MTLNKTAVLFIATFFLSLLNHWVVPWFIGLTILVAYIVIFRIRLHIRIIREGLLLTSALLLFSLKFQLFDSSFVSVELAESFENNFVMYCVYIMIWMCVRLIVFREGAGRFGAVFVSLLWANLLAFYLQFFIYLWFGYYIDFIQPFTGVESRYISFTDQLFGVGSFRPTGLYSEPSNYSAVVLILLSLVMLRDGVRFSVLSVLAIISMYLSYSTAAVIIASALLGYMVLKGAKNTRAVLMIGALLSVAIAFNLQTIGSLYEAQVKKYDRSAGMRADLTDYIFAREGYPLFIGYGPFAVEPEVERATAAWGDGETASLNDSGLLVFLCIEFGLIGAAVFAWLAACQRGLTSRLPLFLLISLTKISLFHPIFIVYMAVSSGAPFRFSKSRREEQEDGAVVPSSPMDSKVVYRG